MHVYCVYIYIYVFACACVSPVIRNRFGSRLLVIAVTRFHNLHRLKIDMSSVTIWLKVVVGMEISPKRRPSAAVASPVGGKAPAVRGKALALADRGKALSLDERIAVGGMSLKLFPHTCPDLWNLVEALQDVHNGCQPYMDQAGEDEKCPGPMLSLSLCMSRAVVLLRILRGQAGVPWGAKQLLKDPVGLLTHFAEESEWVQKTADVLMQARSDMW
jgi:hypothetical protein